MAEEKKEEKKLKFEEALAKLERIVSEIEEGKVSLEESISRYAEGIGLVKHCRKILDAAEQKIQLLAKGEGPGLEPSGEMEEPEENP
jgi:exodeoxyribonuclease VII small subunit